jgi:hypothetical protein
MEQGGQTSNPTELKVTWEDSDGGKSGSSAFEELTSRLLKVPKTEVAEKN